MNNHYCEINQVVMDDTFRLCNSDPDLKAAISKSIENEKVVFEDEVFPESRGSLNQSIVLSPLFTLEAAQKYVGKKIGVLNFANNHHVGGSPFTACAQEESLCHSTTLYPCLLAKQKEFYLRHSADFAAGKLTNLGNDDAIFTPNVIVFKTTGSGPVLLPREQWFAIDVITSAAPQLSYYEPVDEDILRPVLYRRIKRILDIAKKEGDQVLILGAFGCGAFGNSPELVANVMKELLASYSFETVDIAIRGRGPDRNFAVFKKVFA